MNPRSSAFVDLIKHPPKTTLSARNAIKSTKAEDLGFTGDADLAAWPAAVHRVEEKYRGMLVVPGHGEADERESAYERTLTLLAAQAPAP